MKRSIQTVEAVSAGIIGLSAYLLHFDMSGLQLKQRVPSSFCLQNVAPTPKPSQVLPVLADSGAPAPVPYLLSLARLVPDYSWVPSSAVFPRT